MDGGGGGDGGEGKEVEEDGGEGEGEVGRGGWVEERRRWKSGEWRGMEVKEEGSVLHGGGGGGGE